MTAYSRQVQQGEALSSAAPETEAKPGEDEPDEASPRSRPGDRRC